MMQLLLQKTYLGKLEHFLDNPLHMNFLKTNKNNFISNGTNVQLQGVGLGNWLVLEHFMFGIAGTDSQIRQVIKETYGEENYNRFWDKYYTVYVQEADIKYVHERGMNHIRIPVNYKLFFTDEFEKSVAIREINRILEYCKRYNIWAIIDMHAVPGGQNPDWHCDNANGRDMFWQDKTAKNNVVKLWGEIANYYKNEPTIGGYDLINEPCYFAKETDDLMIQFFKDCTTAIRSVNKRHIIFYSGNVYSRDFSMFTENLDDNCSYTFHLYPFLQIANELNSTDIENRLQKCLQKDVTLQHLTETLQKPLWCGETGHPHHFQESFHVLNKYLTILDEKQIGWALWPLKDCGSMAMTYPSKNGEWNMLCNELSEGWLFWNIFTKDSMISAQQESDKYKYYEWLANESTCAWEIVRNNLLKVPFERLLNAVDDFKFENCSRETEFFLE